MDAAHREQIETILGQLSTLSLDQREAFLGKACASDVALRNEVENRLGLLGRELPAMTPDIAGSAVETAHELDLIDSIALNAVTPLPKLNFAQELRHSSLEPEPFGPDSPDKQVGQQIGPYRVDAWIGGGSMGNVYRVTGFEEFAQPLVVKLLKHNMDGNTILQRFRSELPVQIAISKHPYITAFRDAATTDDGHPYFVMEYVDGQQIDVYCNERRLDLRARLELFARVCEAVQFAHQHLVIHSDLKPSNILVTADGFPKIIDFGIARLVTPKTGSDDPVTSMDSILIGIDNVILTPEYVSPEQVSGETITTTSDVYALGVVLYQLLSGHWPYRPKSRSTADILQAICEQVPEKPSAAVTRSSDERPVRSGNSAPSLTLPSPAESWLELISVSASSLAPTPEEVARARRCSPRQLRRILADDLDVITLMALRKEPDQRYASAKHLGEDLHRYLQKMPVRAHRDSVAYRTKKFVHRHAIAVPIGLFSLLALVAGIIGMTAGLVTARRERDQARGSFHEARETVDQLFTHINASRLFDQPGTKSLRKALLLDARRFYEDFFNQRNAGLELRADLAIAQAHIAKITSLTGLPTDAIVQYYQAVALWEKLIAAEPNNEDYQAKQAQTLNDLGVLFLSLDGQLDKALGTFRQAQKSVELLISAHPDAVAQRVELGLILLNIAEIQRQKGKPDEAIVSIERVLALESQLTAEDSQSLEPRIALATAHETLGGLLGAQPSEVLQAIVAYQQAIEWRKTVTREHPELVEQSYHLASELRDLSSLQQRIGQTESASDTLRGALRIFERIDQWYPGVVSYQQGLGSAYNMMSDLERRRGEKAEAFAAAQKAHALFGRLVAENPKNATYRRDLATSHNNLGRLQEQAGEPVEALRSFQHAVDLLESLDKVDPQDSYNLASNVALCIPLIGVKKGLQGASQELTKWDRLRRQLYGDRAIEALRQAAHAGFLDAQTLQDGTDLNSLRARADFRALITQVEEKPAITGK